MKKRKHNSILSLSPDVVVESFSRNSDHHRARAKAGCRSAVEINVGKREAKIYELDRIDSGTASKTK